MTDNTYTPTDEEKKRFDAEMNAYNSIMSARKSLATAIEQRYQKEILAKEDDSDKPALKINLDSNSINPLYGYK